MEKLNELYMATLRNGKHLRVAKSMANFTPGNLKADSKKNVKVVMSYYKNGKLFARREVDYDFYTLPVSGTTWNKFMQEADLYEKLGGREAYINYRKLPDWWRRAA